MQERGPPLGHCGIAGHKVTERAGRRHRYFSRAVFTGARALYCERAYTQLRAAGVYTAVR